MRFIIAPEFYDQMLAYEFHTPDCYVRPGEYLHHMYLDGVKYVIVPALLKCLEEAEAKKDAEALRHLTLHKEYYDGLLAEAMQYGSMEGVTLLGDPPPDDDPEAKVENPFTPVSPSRWEDLGLPMPFIFEIVLRVIYNHTRITGNALSEHLCVPLGCLTPVLQSMRKQTLIDIAGQRGNGDGGFEYEVKPPKGSMALQDALAKTSYAGAMPINFEDYVESVGAQTIRKLVVTRRSIFKAFEDLIITDSVLNEIGPAINSAASIFFFGFPGNGKTSIAERINRLMGQVIYVPHAVEINGQIVKVYDPILHTRVTKPEEGGEGIERLMRRGGNSDQRYVAVQRPTVVVGGELTLPMLDLNFNDTGKYYEAPLQMKANGGILMIDDFGRQQVRPMDLLNRWIVPLEKQYDYLTTVTGMKVEVPFDELLIFSTNLDPTQLADEAFLRRIKFKIEIRDPDEGQYREVWKLLCKKRGIDYAEKGIDYLIEKWYRPTNRPFRMCQPRDLLDQMMAIGKYNMERVTLNPDLIDAGCETYFISEQKRDFGAKVRLY